MKRIGLSYQGTFMHPELADGHWLKEYILYPQWCVSRIKLTIFASKRVYCMTQSADYVKEMRKQFGLTQVDLSRKSGGALRFVR